MPPVKPLLSSLGSASQRLIQCPGLAVTSGFQNWLIYKFSFFINFAVPILEKFGFDKWYKSTEAERIHYISEHGETKLYKITKWVEDNIELVRAGIFIAYLIGDGPFAYLQDRYLEEGDCTTVTDMIDWRDVVTDVYHKSNLIFFVLYDVVFLAAKRFYLYKQRRSGASLERIRNSSQISFGIENFSPGIIINPQQQDISPLSTLNCGELAFRVYTLTESARNNVIYRESALHSASSGQVRITELD